MGRLDFAPKIDDIKITDIKRGLGEFIPKPDKAVSFDAIKSTLKKAGYTLASADIIVEGVLLRQNNSWWLEVDLSKQRFVLEGDDVGKLLQDMEAGRRVEVAGDWQTVGKDAAKLEVIRIRSAKGLPSKTSKATSTIRGESEEVMLDSVQVSLDGLGARRTSSPHQSAQQVQDWKSSRRRCHVMSENDCSTD